MRKYSVLMIVMASLVFVSGGVAGSSLLNGYGGSGSTPVVNVKDAKGSAENVNTSSGSAPAVATSSSGTLPFTGSDLAIFVVVGAGLLTIGAGLRRLGRNES